MEFIANEGCIRACIPTFDAVTFTIDFRDHATFDAFLALVERESGSALESKETKKFGWVKYLRGITFVPPSYDRRGWSIVYFTPTLENLRLLQTCIEQFFTQHLELPPASIPKRVNLKSVELAYDFCLPVNNYLYYEGLVRRIFYRLWPVNGKNQYAVWMSRGLFENWDMPECHNNELFTSFDDALWYYGNKKDRATNGDLTGYVNRCHRDNKGISSNALSKNSRSSVDVKVYPKQIDKAWFLRIEVTLSERKLKDLCPLAYNNFAALFDHLPRLLFEDFLEFREADFAKFRRKLMSLPGSRYLKTLRWQTKIEEAAHQPIADQIRIMRVMADEVGPKAKKLKDSIISNFTRKLTFQEAINRKLPRDLRASRRMPDGEKPDDLEFREHVGIVVRIGQHRYELKPLPIQNGA